MHLILVYWLYFCSAHSLLCIFTSCWMLGSANPPRIYLLPTVPTHWGSDEACRTSGPMEICMHPMVPSKGRILFIGEK